MNRISIFKFISILLFPLLLPIYSFSEESNIPPQCIGDVCLGDHIEKYKNKIEMFGKHLFGPLYILKNDSRYVSAQFDEMDESNWVQSSFCESPGIIKTIHRTIKAEDDDEYYMLLIAYEKKYGKGKNLDMRHTHKKWYKWEWESQETSLSLFQKRNSEYISIELHNGGLAGKDWECSENEAYELKSKEGLVPE